MTYLNVSAAPHTRATVEVQGFCRYSEGIHVSLPALNPAPRGIQTRVLPGIEEPDADFELFERDLLIDHATYGCLSLWCVTDGRAYPFVFRPKLVKGLPIYSQLIYCRDIDDFVRFARPIGRYLARRGKPLVISDSNGPIRGLAGSYFAGRMPKYFRGPDRPRLGDLAYTETALFGV